MEHTNLVFQPIVHLNTKATFGYEVLLRSNEMSTKMYIERAVYTGRIVELDRYIHRKVLNLQHDNKNRIFFINVHPRSFFDIADMYLKNKVNYDNVVLELTEHEDLDRGRLAQYMEKLQRIGVKIALDDFGVGHNNIHLLKDLKPDYIKIDRSYIQGLDHSILKDFTLYLLDLGLRIGATIIAEGIETEDHLIQCNQMGILYGQGYYTGKPASRFNEYLVH